MNDSTPASERVLLVTAVPLDDKTAEQVLAAGKVDGAVVRVLAPSLNDSRLAFWVSDGDAAIAEAHESAARTADIVADLTEDEVTARVGESDPLLAIGDALRTFPADRIVSVRRTSKAASYHEDQLNKDTLERAFGLPVTAVQLPG